MNNTLWKRSLPLWALLTAFGETEQPALAADAAPVGAPTAKAAVAKANPLVSPGGPSTPAPGGDGTAKLKAKLDSIVINEIAFDSMPLGEVVRFLIREAATRDPEKAGVNFLFGQPTDPVRLPASIDPATGLPVSGQSLEIPDLNAVTIRIVPPLRNVRLIDALDAIKRVADIPITYTVESYAVVFSLDVMRIQTGFGATPPKESVPSPAVQFQTRSFKVNTNTFSLSLKRIFGSSFDPSATEGVLRRVLVEYGAKLNTGEHRVFYNDLTGMLLVRCAPEELGTIQAAVETLGGTATDGAARGDSPAVPRNLETSPATLRKQ